MGNPLYPESYEQQCREAANFISDDAKQWIGHHLNNSLSAVLGFFDGHLKKDDAKKALEHTLNDIKTILKQKD